ncbi:MAG TPA: oligosaccharide flippase family protein, partial [Chitinophagaceae bacterium]|nr:oligosaccharide flippase family protein [Chitinophagaceae bacterium]
MVKSRTFSATGIQIIGNQILGLVFFLLLALHLDKNTFGELNWATAVSYTVTVIFTFGFDHVVIRRIAAGGNSHTIAGTYLAHCLVFAVTGFLLMAAHRALFSGFHEIHYLLWLVFLGTLLSYAASPLKQMANGKERFWRLAVMNVSANFFRVIGTSLLILFVSLDAKTLGLLFLAAGLLELITCYLVSWLDERRLLLPVFRLKVYTLMVREALPSLGAVMLESAFARLDWILLGLMSTGIALADYSFAYKAFDSSRIPLLIIAPVLLPGMARLHSFRKADPAAVSRLNRLWQAEAFVSVLIPLVLGVCWVDLV